MPNVDKSSVGFKNIVARSYSPFAVYFDLESVLEKVETVRNNPTCSSTTVIEKHKPSSFCLVVVEAGNPKPAFFSLHRGVDAMTKFVRMLEVLARDFHNKKRRYPNYLGSTSILEDSAVTNAGFAKRNSPKLTRKFWTIIISMDHSSDGLTTNATS